MSEQPDLLSSHIVPEQPDPAVQTTESQRSNAVKELRDIFQRIFAHETSATDDDEKPILIAFDTGSNRKNRFNSIGVSFLDTRYFVNTSTLNPTKTPPSIWTYTYIFGSLGFAKRVDRLALFNGKAKQVSWSDRDAVLAHVFAHHDEDDGNSFSRTAEFRPFQSQQKSQRRGPLRPIIVMGHDIANDHAALRTAGFDIAHAAPVLATLDTQKLSEGIFWPGDPKPEQPSLKRSCRLVGFSSTRNLHHSGNDAAYTLLLALRLASKVLEDGSQDKNASEILNKVVWKTMESCKTARMVKWERLKATKRVRDQIRLRRETDEPKISSDWANNLVVDDAGTSVFSVLFSTNG